MKGEAHLGWCATDRHGFCLCPPLDRTSILQEGPAADLAQAGPNDISHTNVPDHNLPSVHQYQLPCYVLAHSEQFMQDVALSPAY